MVLFVLTSEPQKQKETSTLFTLKHHHHHPSSSTLSSSSSALCIITATVLSIDVHDLIMFAVKLEMQHIYTYSLVLLPLSGSSMQTKEVTLVVSGATQFWKTHADADAEAHADKEER